METLLERISSVDFLMKAWKNLKKTHRSSKGLSGITIDKFEVGLEDNISKISKDLKSESYEFQPTRAAVIKKDSGKYRPLQIPEIRDRVVLKAISMVLEEELDNLLRESKGRSFAYQKGIGVKDAVLKMKELYVKNKTFILKSDIVNFFEEVDKEYLLQNKVFRNLRDNTITTLISSALSQPLKGKRQLLRKHQELFKNVGKGIPQGNPLSPLLSNIYLSDFDKYMYENGFNIIRYADDFIVFCRSNKEAEIAHDMASSFLRGLKLKIHPINEPNSKSIIYSSDLSNFSFLSMKFDGENIFLSPKKIKNLKAKIKDVIHTHNDVEEVMVEIKKIIRRWVSLYRYVDIRRHFSTIESYTNYHLKKKYKNKKKKRFISCENLLENLQE